MKYTINFRNITFLLFFISLKVYSFYPSQLNDTILNDTLNSGINKVRSSEAYTPMLPDIVHPAPTAMEFNKYLGYPISYSTGLIDISIPLYELRTKNVSIPLQLKYHSSGRRVQDNKGIIGYGWSLFPGFRISRTVMGKNDETYPVMEDDMARLRYLSDKEREIELINFATFMYESDWQNGVSEGQIKKDGQYDIFSFHLPGLDGSFILRYENGNFTAQTIPESPLKITPLIEYTISQHPYELYGFEVKDDKGNIFRFGQESHWKASGVNNKPVFMEYSNKYASSWMLREIIEPNGDYIRFTYKEKTESSYGGYAASIVDNVFPSSCKSFTGNSSYSFSVSPVSNQTYRILTVASINSIPVEINFHYNSSYEMLSSITIRDKIQGPSFKTINLTQLENGLLSSLALMGGNKYQFEYNRQDMTIYSEHVDWWGYYNNLNQAVTSSNLPKESIDIRYGSTYTKYTINGISREPNVDAMKVHSLEKVIYPTGGELKITYEPNEFYSSGTEISQGIGLRVKSTELYDPVSNKSIKKRYEYTPPSTIQTYPDLNSLVKETNLCTVQLEQSNIPGLNYYWISDYPTARSRTITTFSPYSFFSNNISRILPVWYEKVTEFMDEGKIVYTYEHEPDEHSGMTYGYYTSGINRLASAVPLLLSEEYYDENNKKVMIIENYYLRSYGPTLFGVIAQPFKEFIAQGYPTNWEGRRNSTFLKGENPGDELYKKYGSPIAYAEYYLNGGGSYLQSVTKSTIVNSGAIVEKTEYEYDWDNDRPYNIISKSILNSKDQWVKEKYYYSGNKLPDKDKLSTTQQNTITQLENNNYKTTVLQQVSELEGKRLYSKMTGYKKQNNMFLPEKSYFQKGTGSFEGRISYHKYDNLGNPIYISMDDATNIVYLWSYIGEYPVAEIRNATYDQVKVALGSNPENYSNTVTPDYTKLNDLRSSLKNAHITTYKYKPLIGITEITDPRGVTTYYEYDKDERLKEIYYKENGQKRIIESYEYNYKIK